MQTSSTQALIVGAGPTGLTMACELLRRGIACRIVEKAAVPTTTSRAIGLQARTLELFANMGIVESALEQGIPGIRVNMYSGSQQLFLLDFRFLADESIPYPYGTLLPQNLTEQILLTLLHQQGGQVERSREVVAVRQTNEQAIVAVKNLEDGGSEEIETDWLIGCDGTHSIIRKSSGIAFEGSTYQEEFLLGDVRMDWDKSHQQVHVWLHKEGQFAAMPLPDNSWRLMADMPVIPGETVPPASLEVFEHLLRERTGDTQTKLNHPMWMSNFRIHRRLADSYRHQRVFLAGDAAHVHSPFGGQGANTGIQDAFNLAWKLALVIQGKASETLLDTYQEERRPIARNVLRATHQLTGIFYQRNLLARTMRDLIALPLLKQPVIQRRLLWETSELGIHYRSSTLSYTPSRTMWASIPVKRKALQAGDRAPDGFCLRFPERTETTLFQVLQKPVAHLLLFDGVVQNEATSVVHMTQCAKRVEQLLKAEVQVHFIGSDERTLQWDGAWLSDTNCHLHTRYGIRFSSLVFIRPDGYIGFLGKLAQESELVNYLQRIYLFPSPNSTVAQTSSSHERKSDQRYDSSVV